MRRVFVVRTGRRVLPFDDPMDEVLVHNRTLSWWRSRAFEEAGLTEIPTYEPPCLVVPDTLLTTGPVLAKLWVEAAGRNATLGLAASVFGTRTTPVQPEVTAVQGGWRFDAVRFDSGGEESPVVVWVDPEEQTIELSLPAAFRSPDAPTALSLPRHPILTLHHWSHVLWANQAAAASEARRTPWWRGLLRVVWAIVRARSLNKWRVMARLNRIGKGCDIHPTATVEASTLGEGVKVGPYARVVFSTLGDGVEVMAGAHVEASTVGEGATLAQMTSMRACVVYPGAFHGQAMMQASVLGRDVLTTLASWCIDLSFEGNLRVPLDGTLHDVGTNFLGAALGHRTRLGTGTRLGPGRALPNDTVWIRHPDDVVSRVPIDPLPGMVVTEEGRLVPWTGRKQP